eukprot:COSAG02_NODE_2021_length_10086_cov_85.351657_9_plen_103_part_00
MNGPECKFLCDHSDLILDRTFRKTPVVGGNAHTCKQTMATGIGRLQNLRKWILCKDWWAAVATFVYVRTVLNWIRGIHFRMLTHGTECNFLTLWDHFLTAWD